MALCKWGNMEDKKKLAFSQNWHHVRKAGGALWTGYASNVRGYTGDVNLDMVVRAGADKKMMVFFDLRIYGRSGYQNQITRCPATLPAVVDHLIGLKSSVSFRKKGPTPAEWIETAGLVLDRAIGEFKGMETKPESILTIRASAKTTEKIRLAGVRSGLRVSSKILLFALDYYLLQTDVDQSIESD